MAQASYGAIKTNKNVTSNQTNGLLEDDKRDEKLVFSGSAENI